MTTTEYKNAAKRIGTQVTQTQLDHVTQWAERYIKSNYLRFKQTGITPTEIYECYLTSCTFPIGMKAFAPILHLNGLEKIKHAKKFLYVFMN